MIQRLDSKTPDDCDPQVIAIEEPLIDFANEHPELGLSYTHVQNITQYILNLRRFELALKEEYQGIYSSLETKIHSISSTLNNFHFSDS